MDLLERATELRRQRRRAVLITVTSASGSTPQKAGARMIIHEDGATEGTVGGGRIEQELRDAAKRVLESGEPKSLVLDEAALDLECGGRMSFFVEPILTQPVLILFGCGHLGSALIRAAAPLGFDITAVDDLEQNANPEKLPQAMRIINSYEPDALNDLPIEEAFVVIITREHKLDQTLLEICLKRSPPYLGVIGSPRKACVQRETLEARGFEAASIETVHCPVGLDIGAQTPEEIAVAICAELIAARRGGPKFQGR